MCSAEEKVYSCGECQELVPFLSVSAHMFFNGASQIYVDDNDTLQLVAAHSKTAVNDTFEGSEDSDLDGNGEINEVIIMEVQNRPALWDNRLPISARSKIRRDLLWKEISEKIKDLSPEDVAKRWKSLHDRFMKVRNIKYKYVPSGSGAQNLKHPNFKYYEVLTFLTDTMDYKRTSTSLETTSSPSPSGSEHTGKSELPKTKKRPRTSTLDAELLEELKKKPEPPTFPKPDEIDGFCARLAGSLRRLPLRSRALLEIKILELVYKEEHEAQ